MARKTWANTTATKLNADALNDLEGRKAEVDEVVSVGEVGAVGGVAAHDDTVAALAGKRTLEKVKVSDLITPWVMPHRGFGRYVGPDNSLNAMRACLATAPDRRQFMLDGGDVTQLKDGTLVLMHDTSLSRTTSSTGDPSIHTAASWQQITIDPPNCDPRMPGWPNEPAPYLDDVLREFGGECVIQLELKHPETVGAMQDLVDAILKHDLRESIQISCFSLSALAPVVEAGMAASVSPSSPSQYTVQQMVDAGLTFMGYQADNEAGASPWKDAAARTFLASVAAAGIKLIPWTLDRRSDWAIEQALPGVVGVASNNPWYLMGWVGPFNTDNFALGVMDYGIMQSMDTAGTSRPTVSGGKLVVDDTTHTSYYLMLGNVSRATAPSRVDLTITWNQLDTTTDRHVDVMFGFADDTEKMSGTSSGGYSFIFRQNGNLELWRDSTQIVATTASTPVVQGASTQVTVEFVGTTVKVTRQDTGTVLSAVDNTYRGGYMHVGRLIGSGANKLKFSVSGITVTP